jgi:hypothetical protein
MMMIRFNNKNFVNSEIGVEYFTRRLCFDALEGIMKTTHLKTEEI